MFASKAIRWMDSTLVDTNVSCKHWCRQFSINIFIRIHNMFTGYIIRLHSVWSRFIPENEKNNNIVFEWRVITVRYHRLLLEGSMALTVSKCHTFIECARSYRLWDAYALHWYLNMFNSTDIILHSFRIFVPHSMLKTFKTSTVLNKLIQSIIMQMFKFPIKSIAALKTKSLCFCLESAKEGAHQSTHAFQWNLIIINDRKIQTSNNKKKNSNNFRLID